MNQGKSIPAKAWAHNPFSRFGKFASAWARKLSEAGNRALLPSVCVLCGASGDHQALCPDCRADLPEISNARCPVCLEATTHGERCGACLVHPPHFDRVFALYDYVFPVDRLILKLKYNARFDLARFWGNELAARLSAQWTTQTGASRVADCVIPLPLHDDRLAGRGYNQALEIARHFARAVDIPLDGKSLKKCRATRPQSESSLRERRHNLRNAFVCNHDLSGQRILLIDDVLTTGTTANEAARVLKSHGATGIMAVVVARTPKHGDAPATTTRTFREGIP
jgi:ComF family protein